MIFLRTSHDLRVRLVVVEVAVNDAPPPVRQPPGPHDVRGPGELLQDHCGLGFVDVEGSFYERH